MDTYDYVTINPSADRILVVASGSGIRAVAFGDFETVLAAYPDAVRTSNPILNNAGWQISEYLQGTREEIEAPLDIAPLPPYHQQVLGFIRTIPYGETTTYAEVARETGHPGASRAVGNACKANPVPILIPCHRVVPKSGTIGNYIGGTEFKELLLSIEHSHH